MPDLTNWESVIRDFESSGLPEDYKKPAVEALSYIREQFGDNWIEYAKGRRHPLLSLFGNIVPWCAGLIADQAEEMRRLAGVEGFSVLLGNLRQADFRADVSVMDTAYRFSRFTEVTSLHPTMNGREKDIVVRLDGRETVLEVTNSNSPLENRERQTFENIVVPIDAAALGSHGITVRGRIFKPLSRKRAEEGNGIVSGAIDRARLELSPQRAFLERAFDLMIYPKEKYSGITYRIEGIPFEDGEKRRAIEIDRLDHIIKEKSEQLVEGIPGGVVVYSDPDYFVDTANESDFAERLVNDLEEALYDRDKLSFFVLMLIDIGGGDERRNCEDYLYRKRTKHEMLCERVLVIRNKYATQPISLEELAPLVS